MELRTLSDANIEKLLQEPRRIWQVLEAQDPDAAPPLPPMKVKQPNLLQRLLGMKIATTPVSTPPRDTPGDLVFADNELRTLDMAKTWHGIHFLLTGTSWEGEPPMNFLLGGREVGDIDVGYGPARALTAAEVAAFSSALQSISDEELKSRFVPAQMEEVYPTIWDRDPADDDALGWLMEFMPDLRKFVADAGAEGLGVVATLS